MRRLRSDLDGVELQVRVGVVRAAVLLAVAAAALLPLALGAQFPDSETDPHFFHGPVLWVLVSRALMMSVGAGTKNPWAALLAGMVPLFISVARGEISPLLVLVLVTEGVSAVILFIVMRR